MKQIFKKTFAIMALVAVIFTNIPVYVFATELDTSRPAVTIGAASSSTVEKGGSVSYNVAVNDNVGVTFFRLNASNITLNGFDATITVTETGDFTRKITFSNIVSTSDKADKYFTISAGAVKDAAGNTSVKKMSPAFKIVEPVKPAEPLQPADTSKPAITISAATPGAIYEGETVKYTITANDNVKVTSFNVTTGDIQPVGFKADITVSGSGNVREVVFKNITETTTDANKYFTLAAGVAKDAAGNASVKKTSPAFKVMEPADTSKPAITISAATPGAIYEGETVKYTITANDNVKVTSFNITTGDVQPVGFKADITISGSGNVREVVFKNITETTTDANKYFTLAAGVAKDAAGNASVKKTSPAFKVMEPADTSKPAITISAATPGAIYEGETVKYTITANDNVKVTSFNITTEDVQPVGFKADITISGSGNVREVVFKNITETTTDANKYFTLAAGVAKDAAGNASVKKTSPAFKVMEPADTSKPAITISAATPGAIYEGETVKYTITANDNVKVTSFNVTTGDVQPVGFKADITISGSGNVREVVFKNITETTTDANKYFTLAAGVAKDAAGNASVKKTSPAFKVMEPADTSKPAITISAATPGAIYEGETVKYTITANDNVKVTSFNIATGDIQPVGFKADITVSGSGNVREVVFKNITETTTDANKYFTLAAGVAKDAAGNTSVKKTSPAFKVMEPADTSKPAITISAATPGAIYEGETVKYTITANDNVKVTSFNITTGDVQPVGFKADITISGSGNVREVVFKNITETTTDANKYFTLAAGVAKDAAGNASVKKTSPAFKVMEPADTSKPAITISAATPGAIYEGETVKYTITANDNVKVTSFNITTGDIQPVGFKADITVSGSGNVREVVFKNITETTTDANKYFTLAAGVAKDAAGNASVKKTSPAFKVMEKVVVPEIKDTIAPIVQIGSATPKSVYAGGTVRYSVTFTDDVKVTAVSLTADKVELVGFTADISIKVNGLKSAEITLKNIKGNAGVNKYIKITSGVALDEPGNRSAQAISPKFSIIEKTIIKPTTTKYTLNCIDDLSLLGDINKEITYFASWLRAEKYTASFVQENNYVAEDETMTYMVEYYNGSTAPAPDVTFDLTIPYKVVVEEINGNGKIVKQTENETVIRWNVGTVPSYYASQGRGYCRLYVRVRFLENESLEKSNNISETFYATLKTTADGNHSYSYMRQLFIDKTEGKTGTYKRYLTTVDTNNQVRPNDEITRAEFAKLLADSGILDVKVGSKDYKTFKDHEAIPAYARDAVSALTKTNIIQAFPDGEFKPNHPILMEDAMQMLAQAATYISEQKLTVYKPVFLYTEALKGRDNKVSEKKDYIMELMRQNVVVKYESNPDTYALRKDVVAMVNSLTFRGPYVETLPENTLKFADIRDDSVFFYNIVGASNSYKYTYDYRLWQQIVEIVK